MSRFLLAALLLTLGVALVLRALPGEGQTVLSSARQALTHPSLGDSWRPMAEAVQAWRKSPGVDIYSATFGQGDRFQYPPTALFVAMLADAVSPGDLNAFYAVPSLLMLALTILGADRVLAEAWRSWAGPGEPTNAGMLRLALVAALCLIYYPVMRALELGQIQLWLDGLFAMALWRWFAGDRVVPGVLIALICLIKPQLSLFFPWALIRREWRFAATLAVVGGIGLLASLAVFGLPSHLGYLDVLSFLAKRGEPFHANQSMNGLLNRIVGLGQPDVFNNLDWRERHFAPENALVRIGTAVSSAVILGLALWPRARARDVGRTFDFCTLALSCTIASPVAWEHHYGLAFPIFALLLPASMHRGAWLLGLAVCYTAVAQLITATDRLASTWFNVLQSHVFIGGLGLLLMLHLGPPGARGAPDTSAEPRNA